MKKITVFFLAMLMAISLFGCSSDETDTAKNHQETMQNRRTHSMN